MKVRRRRSIWANRIDGAGGFLAERGSFCTGNKIGKYILMPREIRHLYPCATLTEAIDCGVRRAGGSVSASGTYTSSTRPGRGKCEAGRHCDGWRAHADRPGM